MRDMSKRGWACVFLAAALGVAATAQAANGVVGPGNCNEDGFGDVLAAVDGSGGGTITFACGTATIAFSQYQHIANAVVIDGGGTITFDGGNASAFLQVYASAHATLRRLTLRHGKNGDVHALENFGVLRLDRVHVQDNVSDGAAVANDGTLVVQASTFSGNRNTGLNGDGGAIAHRNGDLIVRTSTFSGNVATRNGGAIHSSASATIVDSTFNANSAGGGGAAFYQEGSGASRIDYATIAGNSASFGGGLYKEGSAAATLTIGRSIIADNPGGNCDGVLESAGYNLWFGATQCPFSQAGDGAGNPLLGALANNGGPTQTMLPAGASAAADRIPSMQCLFLLDQRGGGRPAGAGCDSGAVEVGAVLDLLFQDGFEY